MESYWIDTHHRLIFHSAICNHHRESLPATLLFGRDNAPIDIEDNLIPAKANLQIRVAHSPDSDDAFMFYALACRKIDTGGLEFVHELKDIETLNRDALQGKYEISAISFHAYAYVGDKYVIMPCGASMGDGYGPIVVSRKPMDPRQLRGRSIAVPGEMTSAYLALRLYEPDFKPQFMPFDRIIDGVVAGEVDAGLLIHEGQLTYGENGLSKVVDLGQWWHEEHGLPLPLGCNVIRRDLGPELISMACRLMRESIEYSLQHRQEALEHALQYARGLDPKMADRFVGMYVNRRTVGYGEDDRRSIALFLAQGCAQGIIRVPAAPEFASEAG
jgi:1,4-dihydroxy-6-naphthoate synthase